MPSSNSRQPRQEVRGELEGCRANGASCGHAERYQRATGPEGAA